MNQAFKKYMKLLQESNTKLYQVYINIDVRYFQEGQLRGFQQLAKGMQDLMSICLRLAFVEAIYQDGTSPLLILDDPFTNLDARRLEGAKIMIEKISEVNQVLYLIYNESRMI